MARTRKSQTRKPRAKRAKRVTKVQKKATQREEILFRVEGKMSTFGGPHDLGMGADDDLALFTKADLRDPKYAYLFLAAPPPGTSGLGRRLNPDQYYFACRWNYSETPKEFLRRSLARVENPRTGGSRRATGSLGTAFIHRANCDSISRTRGCSGPRHGRHRPHHYWGKASKASGESNPRGAGATRTDLGASKQSETAIWFRRRCVHTKLVIRTPPTT
jgi:hypothetical protein